MSGYVGFLGVWFLCEITEVFENRKPVKYWVQNPAGYPWQIKLKPVFPYRRFDREFLDKIKPVRREELASIFGIQPSNRSGRRIMVALD